MLPIWVLRGIGGGVLAGGSHLLFDSWKLDVAIAVVGSSLPQSLGGRLTQAVGRGTVRAGPTVLRGIYRASARAIGWGAKTGVRVYLGETALMTALRSAVAGTAVYLSAVTLGYMIGAVGGTYVSGQLFGEEGKRHALDFYTGKGKYGEYFDITHNVGTIYNAYFGG